MYKCLKLYISFEKNKILEQNFGFNNFFDKNLVQILCKTNRHCQFIVLV